MNLFCLKFSRDSDTSCSPNVKQTNKLKTTKQKHPSSHDDDADKRIDRIYGRVKTFASSSKIFILESRKIWRFHPVVLQKTNGEY